jgi:hypothetical protein
MVNRVKQFLDGSGEATKYDEFYEIESTGGVYVVSMATALYVERCLDACGAQPMWVEFRDMFGARHRALTRNISRITESTRNTRALARAFIREREQEERSDEDPLAELK